jgi:hypothetical protein
LPPEGTDGRADIRQVGASSAAGGGGVSELPRSGYALPTCA